MKQIWPDLELTQMTRQFMSRRPAKLVLTYHCDLYPQCAGPVKAQLCNWIGLISQRHQGLFTFWLSRGLLRNASQSACHTKWTAYHRCTQVNFFLAKSSYKSQVQGASQFTSFQQIIGPIPSQVKLNRKWAKSSHKYLTWFKSILKYMFYGKMLFCVGLHSKPSLGLECRPTPNW